MCCEAEKGGCLMYNRIEEEIYCQVCCLEESECVCPECWCGQVGNSWCYVEHGMRLDEVQKFWREAYDRAVWEAVRESLLEYKAFMTLASD